MKRLLLVPLVALLVVALYSCHNGEKIPTENVTNVTAMNKTVANGPTVHAMGSPVQLFAPLPKVGEEAPRAMLTNGALEDVDISSYKGTTLILNIFPSIDTKTCSFSVHRFNEEAAEMKNVKVLCISMDLPFAQKRFCGAEGITNVETLSAFRTEFPEIYGVKLMDGKLKGLLARTVIVINPDGKVGYTQLVSEISEEPDYKAVLEYLSKAE